MTKLDASGAALSTPPTWAEATTTSGFGIALDGAGNAYLTGDTASADFPTTPGAFDTTYNGGYDAFVTKLDASGAALVYSTYLGGSGGPTEGYGIALDGAGNAYLTGYTDSADFPTTAGAFDTTFNGGRRRLRDEARRERRRPRLLHLPGRKRRTTSGHGIAVDGAGSAYLTGGTDSADFPTTAGAFDTTFDGGADAFVTKLDASGAALGYSTYLGGSEHDYGYGIALDGAGNAYLTGVTTSPDFPTTAGAFDTTYNGGSTPS